MFDREEHISETKLVHPEWSQEQLEKDADFTEKKISRIKRGDKVIHIKYIGTLLSDENLEEIEKNLSVINYELSSFDEAGILKNSSPSFVSEVILYLNDYTIQQPLISGILTNALWDCIKSVALFTWKEVRKKTYYKATPTTVSESKASFSIKTKSFEFNTENLSEETFERSLDKILAFLKEQKEQPKKSDNERFTNHIAIYNLDSEKWEIVNFTPELLKSSNAKIIKTMSIEEFIKREK